MLTETAPEPFYFPCMPSFWISSLKAGRGSVAALRSRLKEKSAAAGSEGVDDDVAAETERVLGGTLVEGETVQLLEIRREFKSWDWTLSEARRLGQSGRHSCAVRGCEVCARRRSALVIDK